MPLILSSRTVRVNMKIILSLLLFTAALRAQPKLILNGPSPIKAGVSSTLQISLTGSGGAFSALQFAILSAVPVTLSGTVAGKSLTCTPSTGYSACVYAGGAGTFTDGPIVDVQFTALPTNQSLQFQLSSSLAVTPAADVATTVQPGSSLIVLVLSPCDVDSNGKVDSADVNATAVQAILTILDALTGSHSATGIPDLDNDGKTTLIEVQRVINAAGGGACRVGP